MSTIGNILWFLFGGLIGGLAWVLAGCLWCITIIGIPVGLQCFKFASLAFFPFGKEVVYGGGGFSFLVNLIWIIFFGLEMAIGYCILGCLWCITIVGIPIGMQCFKFAALSFFPFGKEVTYGGGAGSLLLNILWMIISGIPLALESALFGILICITIVGIPFGLQHFKIAKLALMPFGAEVY